MLKTQALISSVQSLISRVSSFMTLLENYPENTTVEDLLGRLGIRINTSFDLLNGILEVLGVNEEKILQWYSKIITPAWLDAFGENIKYLLLLQLKNVFTCQVNPFLPDNLMEKYRDFGVNGSAQYVKGDTIDVMGTLEYSPINKNGSKYYFDNILDEETVTGITDSTGTFTTDTNAKGTFTWKPAFAFTNDTLYQSRDFDTFLYYLLHEADNFNLKDRRKCIWDNRIKVFPLKITNNTPKEGQTRDDLKKQPIDNFFSVNAPQSACTYEKSGEETVNLSFLTTTTGITGTRAKKEFFLFEPVKDGTKQMIRMTLNPNHYYQKYTVPIPVPTTAETTTTTTNGNETPTPTKAKKGKKSPFVNDLGNVVQGVKSTVSQIDLYNSAYTTNIGFNKTLFEFDYDFLSSIKIFDSKVILARILDAMSDLTLSVGLNLKLSETTQGIKAVVQNIVHDVMEEIEEINVDKYFKFSNKEYDEMLNSTQADVDNSAASDEILNELYKSSDATLTETEQQSAVTNLITFASSATTAAQNGDAGTINYLTLGSVNVFQFIKQMLEVTITEMVTSILSPKIAMIFAVNSYIIGSDDVDLTKGWNFSDFFKEMKNLIVGMAKQILQQILDELYAYVVEILQMLVEKIVLELTLERIEFYKRQLYALKRLLESAVNTVKNSPLLNTILGLAGGTAGFASSNLAAIDNVDYADIIPTQTEP